jgi:hypothetical protein
VMAGEDGPGQVVGALVASLALVSLTARAGVIPPILDGRS